jgi:hypothetical protein
MWKNLTILVIVALGIGAGSGASPIASAPTSAQSLQPLVRCAGANSPACLSAARRSVLAVATKKKDTKLSGGLDALAAQAQILDISAALADQLPKALRDLTKARLMRLDDEGRVQVYVESKQPGQLVHVLEALGAKIERVNEEYGIVQAWLPADELNAAAELPAVTHIRLPDYGFARAGSVTTEGDALQNAAALRSAFGVDGTGVRVGVISDGVEGLAASQASGDLPAVNTSTCNVSSGSPTAPGAGAEGTALLEIVHDLAPGAELWYGFWDANGDTTDLDFSAAVDCLASNVDIVVDDFGFYNVGPYDGTSRVSASTSAALNDASNRIRGYYTAVGNDAEQHYEEPFNDDGTGYHRFHQTATTVDGNGLGARSDDPVLVPAGAIGMVFIQWNDPFGGSCNDYDAAAWVHNTSTSISISDNEQSCSQDPTEELIIDNSAGQDMYADVTIQKFSGSPRTLDVFYLDAYPNFVTACGSVSNNSDAGGGVVSVGAIDASRPGATHIESFSSCGPTNDGRLKPEASGMDGVAITGNGGFGSPFFGTSAAAPHVAGIAALLLQCNPALTRDELRDALLNTAVDLGAPGPDNDSGYGRLDGLAAGQEVCSGNVEPTNTPPLAATATPGSTPTAPTNTATRTATRTRTPTRTPTRTQARTYGDVNCDGRVQPTDATIVLQFFAGLTHSLACPQNGDVNRDGSTNSVDALLILQYVAGLLPSL